ncbi:SHOCT domain-containing protein [Spirulina sp. CCNP1310]|uniref:SHOCT domain-containing protein n=1 Tax=Spirulina sp. CCNP1310 TaxID=3110249 RepID=UPI003A4C5A7E
MAMWEEFNQQPRNQKVAILLALLGAIPGLPLAGVHKFYLRQPLWGVVYLALFLLPIPHVASGLEALWYLLLNPEQFYRRFNPGLPLPTGAKITPQIDPVQVQAIAAALRDLEQLRQEGLISEYEFEQKRRQLLEE